MKRKSILCVMTALLLLTGGCGRGQGGMSYIGADQARQLALNACGKTEADTEAVTADLVSYNGQDCYQVDITVAGQKYRYQIHAVSGAVIDLNVTNTGTDSAENSGNTSQPDAGQAQTGQPDASQAGAGQPDAGQAEMSQPGSATHLPAASSGEHRTAQAPSDFAVGGSTGTADEMILLEDAKAIALEHARLNADQVVFVEGRLDYENGRKVYELEFYSDDYREFDYEIDAYSGEIVSFDADAEHGVLPQAPDGAITADEAKELALDRVPGAVSGDIAEFEMDYDDGRIEYEGKIIYGGVEYEFEIDGGSGQFLGWEEEPVERR